MAIYARAIAPNKQFLSSMMERLLHFFAQYPVDLISHLSSSLSIIVGALRYKYLSPNLKAIWVLFIFNFSKDTYSLVVLFTEPSNAYIYNIEPIYQTALVGVIFYLSFDSFSNRRIIIVLTSICVLITVLYYQKDQVSTVSLSVFKLFAIALSLSYLNKVVMDMRVKNIMGHSMFWFTAGLLIYAAGTFFTVLFSEFIFNPKIVDDETFDIYWNLNSFLFILFAILSAVSIWFGKFDRENLM